MSETEVNLMDTQAFRRLHRIKQLAHTHLVYPSALHTRFEHSLGVMHVAGRVCDRLGVGAEEKELVRLAGLLHDVGHGPFSHLFEGVLEKINRQENIHEKIGNKIIREDGEIDDVLRDHKSDVADLLNKTGGAKDSRLKLLTDIVSGNLDADKMDYLRRDSYYLGVSYGMFDLERVIHTLTHTPEFAPSLAIDAKGRDALENYRLARYLMHAQVYKHHTRLAADQMFLRAVDIAIHEEGIIQADALKLSASDFLDFYLELDDDSVCSIIMNSEDAVTSKDIIRKIRQRKLLKRICQFTHLVSPNLRSFLRTQNNLDEIGERLAHKFGIPPHDLIFYKSELNIKLYDLDDLPVVEDGQLSSVERNSPVTKKADVVTFYVFGPSDKQQRSDIESEISRELGVDLNYVQRY